MKEKFVSLFKKVKSKIIPVTGSLALGTTVAGFGVSAAEAGDVTAGLTTFTSVFASLWSLMTGNPLIMVFVAASLIGVAAGIFKKLRK